MNKDTLLQYLDNKSIALRAKMERAKDEGMIELYEVCNDSHKECQITSFLVRRGLNVTREKLVEYILADVPDLALYFNSDNINAILADTIKRAFDRLATEKGQWRG